MTTTHPHRTLLDLLAERRILIAEQRRERDAMTLAMLTFQISAIDKELEERTVGL